jgi:hypothetical protein
MRAVMRVFAILLMSLFATDMVWATEDVEDFSLDEASGSDPDAGTMSEDGSGSSDILNNVNSSSDLFGDAIPDVPITNSGKIANPSASPDSKSTAPPANSGKISPESGIRASIGDDFGVLQNASKSSAQPTGQQPANAGLSSPATPASNGVPQDPSASPQLEPANSVVAPQATLQGDGSVAPVKQADYLPAANQFGGVPPLPGTRRDMAPGEAPEVYDVEEGDTMFDVCNQLIDDGNYWPKLWSLNPGVSNPHFIYPGMKLAFYGGDSENPPYIEVVAEDEVVPVEKGEIKEAELVVEAEVISEGGRPGGSTVQVPPPPTNQPFSTMSDEAIDVVSASDISAEADVLDGFIFAGRRYGGDDVEYIVPAFVVSQEREPLAEVVSGLSGEVMFGNEKRILLRPEGDLGIGTYSILRPSGDVESLRSGDFVGYRYEFAGNVRVLRRTKTGLLEGVVFDSRTPIMEGDIAVNFIATKRSIPSSSSVGAVSSANSSVIGFEEPGKSVGGKGDLVFLEKTGVSVGGFYAIFKTEENREVKHSNDSDVSEDAGSVAVVRVVEVSGESALGYIVGATGEVRVGDSLSL